MKKILLLFILVLLAFFGFSQTRFRNGVFLHHSTGGNIWGPNGSATSVPKEVTRYNTEKSLTGENAITMIETGWPVTPWDNEWYRWHKIFNNLDTVDADIRPYLKDYKIIVIKSCFPSSSLESPGKASDTLNVTKKTVYNYKWHWRNIVNVMKKYPQNFFVIWTNAPLVSGATDATGARLSKDFCKWAKDTLVKGLDPVITKFPSNIYVFDFFSKLTDDNGFLRSNYAASNTDSHPNSAATALVAPQFVKEIFDAAIAYESKSQTSNEISGVLSIGGVSPDFTTLADAVKALKTRTIKGDITFNIRDGVYTEKLDISNISSEYNIVFQSQSADTSKVKLSYSTTKAYDDFILLSKVKNITFKNLTFSNSGNAIGQVIRLKDGANNIKFLNNLFIADYKYSRLIFSEQPMGGETGCQNLEFTGNNFVKGLSAIELSGGFWGIYKNLKISNNTFKDQETNGIALSSCENVAINSNLVTSSIKGHDDASAFGIGLKFGKDFEISQNKIFTSFGSGISLKDCSNETTLKKLICNNFITTTVYSKGITGEALDIDNSKNIDIIFNSLRVIGAKTGFTNSCLNLSESSNINILNNIVYNDEFYAVMLDSKDGITRCDYNLLSGGSNRFALLGDAKITNFDDWKVTTSCDSHSVTGILDFQSENNLHANSSLISDNGIPWALVTKDIDNQDRNSTAPDIGADEFEFINHPPVIKDQEFTIDENTTDGTQVGKVAASDQDAGQVLSYAITAGNSDNAFSINILTGIITVNNSVTLDYETNPSFTLLIEVKDNGNNNLTASANVKIELADLVETGFNSLNEKDMFSIYPNPSKNQLFIKSSNLLSGNRFEIYDSAGKLVINKPISQTITPVDISSYSGTLIIKIITKDVVFIKKMLKF